MCPLYVSCYTYTVLSLWLQELVREKHVLQSQLNEHLVQISALRNQLDEMRHRKDFTDTPEAIRRLEMEREKSEDKDKQVSVHLLPS